MVAFLKGVAPIMAVEIGRRVVPGHVRPSFKEVEQACRNRGSSAAGRRDRRTEAPPPAEAGADAAAAGGESGIKLIMPTPPIIVIKKKGGHGGHHGGAWKVAYADFVTAMMALFIVLVAVEHAANQCRRRSEAIFEILRAPRRKWAPTRTAREPATASRPRNRTWRAQVDQTEHGAAQRTAAKEHPASINDLEKLRKNIEMTVTAEGLRIELLESEKGTFFDSGSSALNREGKRW